MKSSDRMNLGNVSLYLTVRVPKFRKQDFLWHCLFLIRTLLHTIKLFTRQQKF